MTLASFGLAVLFVAVAMSAAMTVAWFAERRSGHSGWIDVVWTFGLGAAGLIGTALPFGQGLPARKLLVAVLILAWAMRLGLHIAARNRGIGEDPRYAKLKRDWGADEARQLFRMLQMQALASIPLGLGVILAASNPSPALGLQDLAGAALFVAGIIGGGLSDRQLAAFKRDPANKAKVCDAGLWSWSRHPNYFFECVLWSAYAVIAVGMAGYPFGWAALLAPVCITLLLTRVSGIPPLEEHMLEKHGEAYRAYQRRTNAFLPWPPSGRTGD